MEEERALEFKVEKYEELRERLEKGEFVDEELPEKPEDLKKELEQKVEERKQLRTEMRNASEKRRKEVDVTKFEQALNEPSPTTEDVRNALEKL